MQQPPKLFILPLTVHFPKGFVGFSVSLPALRRGAIEHIAPLGSCEFAEDYRKIGAFCRVDVGIDPYVLFGEVSSGASSACALRSRSATSWIS